MERKINDELLKWKRDYLNKTFFLYGPRCVGKTFSVLEFGKKYYRNIAYFNLANNEELLNIIEKEKSYDRLISKLSLFCGESIFSEDTLIVLDNCNDERSLKDMKIFIQDNSPYAVIIISSNRQLVNKTHIEGFFYRSMNNLDFFEYLNNSNQKQLIDFIKDSYENSTPMPFHQMALDTYYEFLSTGGFPEVVNARLNGATDLEVEAIKNKILDVYRSSYLENDNLNNSLRSEEIVKSLPLTLIKENKKYQYGMIKKGARSKDYDGNINSLVSNGFLNRSYRLIDVKSPLLNARDLESFKLYFNDVGLLYSMLFLNKTRMLTDDNIKRSLIENDVANTLIKLGYSLYYYQSDGKAEIQFVIQNRMGKIIPIEIVNMKLTKAKAMSIFLSKYNLTDCIRLTEDNFSKKKNVRYIPIYASCCLKDI